jgi:hypothetical protein
MLEAGGDKLTGHRNQVIPVRLMGQDNSISLAHGWPPTKATFQDFHQPKDIFWGKPISAKLETIAIPCTNAIPT